MQTPPYSIYIDKRPFKIAFIVDPNGGLTQIDKITEYNQTKWGGRYNPIVLSDGKSIDKEWWEFLVVYDPDIIKSLVPLSDSIIKRIENFLSPYSLEIPHRQEDKSVHIQDEGLSILPTVENVALVSRSFMKNSSLVLFEIDKLKDPILKKFIKNNFGTYTHTIQIDQALSGSNKIVFNIANRDLFARALTSLSTFERFTYPIQLCSLPNHLPNVEYDRMGKVFTVVVGNSFEDMVYAWNRSLHIPDWKRKDLNQIWLPLELANDPDTEDALRQWLQRAADPSGSTNEEIHFVSFSVKKEKLEKIAERLTENQWLIKNVTVFSKPQIPKYSANVQFIYLKEGMDLYRATGEQESIVLKEPDVLEGIMSGEHWMADVYIQSKSKMFSHYVNKDFWYQLPKRNILAHQIFNKPSRIGLNGLPSVVMKRGMNTLSINTLSDTGILRSLIVCENTPAYTSDPRTGFISQPFYRTQRSDKGRYLTGFLGLFSGLFNAHHVLERRYWRDMFESMASKELPFEHFAKKAEDEIEEYNKKENQKFEFDKKDLNRAISNLMENNVLLAGIRYHCPLCGLANWHSVEDMRQVLECVGCTNKYSLEAEPRWYYRLNSLVQGGCVQHGLIPVTLVLGQLLDDSRTSFIMSPSLELYNKGDDDPFGELDIVCIKDGKFIIGEVKKSRFKQSDFDRMSKIAELIKPDKVIFSALDRGLTELVRKNINALNKRLNPLGVTVEWYQLNPYIFEPSLVL